MKKLITTALILLSFSLSALGWADEPAVPEYLKDGEITVTLKDGSHYTFKANEFKIVNRLAPAKKVEVAQPAPAKEPASIQASSELPRKHQAIFTLIPQIGVGQDGVKTTAASGGTVTDSDRKAIFGLTACGGTESLPAKLCGLAFSNQSYTLGVGVDF